MTAYKSVIDASLSCPRKTTLFVHPQLLPCPTNPPQQIAECNELIVAKIARMDYPHNWYVWTYSSAICRLPYRCLRPSLFTQIMPVVESGLLSLATSTNAAVQSTLVLRRSLKVLNSVLKEFSNVKMPAGIKTMSQV